MKCGTTVAVPACGPKGWAKSSFRRIACLENGLVWRIEHDEWRESRSVEGCICATKESVST